MASRQILLAYEEISLCHFSRESWITQRANSYSQKNFQYCEPFRQEKEDLIPSLSLVAERYKKVSNIRFVFKEIAVLRNPKSKNVVLRSHGMSKKTKINKFLNCTFELLLFSFQLIMSVYNATDILQPLNLTN